MLRRQGMGFRKCPGLGSTAKWSPCAAIERWPSLAVNPTQLRCRQSYANQRGYCLSAAQRCWSSAQIVFVAIHRSRGEARWVEWNLRSGAQQRNHWRCDGIMALRGQGSYSPTPNSTSNRFDSSEAVQPLVSQYLGKNKTQKGTGEAESVGDCSSSTHSTSLA